MIIAAAALAACAQSEQVTETTEEIEANISTPGGAAELNEADRAIASGELAQGESRWFTRTTVQGPWAGYGPPASEAAFSVRCEAERLIFNTTEMPPSGPGQTQMQLAASGFSETLTAQATEEGLPNTEASVPVGTEWLGQLESASGDLTVTVGESEPLTVPLSEPLTSLISDCRS